MNKIIIIRVMVLAVAIFFAKHSISQEKKMLTLKEAIDLSIQNSKQLKAARARIDATLAQVKEAEDNRLPGFNISGSYLRLSSANIDIKTKSANPGTIPAASPKISQALYGIANLSFPVYSGGKIKYGIEAAKYLSEAAKLDAANNKESVILNTLNAYANLYKSAATISIITESLMSSRQRDTTFYRFEQNGLLARNDLLKAELQTSNIELALLDAENNWKLANINMNLMLGLPESTELIIDTTAFRQVTSIKNIDEYEQLAIQNRKDIQALNYRKKAAAVAIKSANTEAYPNIALTGGYVAAYVPNIITITNALNVGIGVQYNLASLWKTNTKLQQAKAKEKELQANEGELNDAIRLQINQDYQNYLLSQKRIEVYQKSLQQATENFRITKNKYDNSLVTVTELLDADVALTQAKLNLSISKADAILAYNKLLYTTGLLSAQ